MNGSHQLPGAITFPQTLLNMIRGNRVLLLVYLVTFAIHLLLIVHPPTLFFYTTDEELLTFSAIDRFMGVPPISLQWPGTTLQMFFIPVFVLMFLFKSGLGGPVTMAAHFATFLANSYEYPQNVITAMRLISLGINSAAPVLTYVLVRKLSRSAGFAALTAILFTLQPLLFEYSVIALGDAVSITFALAGVTVLVCSDGKYRLQLSAFLFAAAVASKATIAGVILLGIAFILLDSATAATSRWKALVNFVLTLIVAFIFWNPYLWTDPIRYVKAFAGTALKPGAAPSILIFAGKFEAAMGITFTVLAILVVIAALVVQFAAGFKPKLSAALAILGLVLLPVFLSATRAESRYLLPALPVLVVLAALTWSAAEQRFTAVQVPRVALSGLIALTIVGVTAEATLLQANARQPSDLTNAIAYTQNLQQGMILYVPQEAIEDAPFLHASTATLSRIVASMGPRLQSDVGTVAYLTSQHMPAVTARELVQAFNDHEQSTFRELIARTEHTGSPAWDLFIYASPLDANRRAKRTGVFDMDQDEALTAARSGHNRAILLDRPRPDLGQPAWRGGRLWVWYVFK